MPQAEQDIDEALNYIANELCNPDAAEKLIDGMAEIMGTVSAFPFSFPTLKDKRLTQGNEYRRADINNFVLIFKVAEDLREVRVMAALYAPSDVVARLLKRI